MAVSLFLKKRKSAPVPSKLEDITLRGFGGGLNVVDSDVNVEPKYQTTLVNFQRATSGAQRLRFGNAFFSSLVGTVSGGRIVDMFYFNNRIVAVTSLGEIATVTNAGVSSLIWNNTIAGALPGAPAGWSALTQVDFVPWKDQLIIHNGIDKPIILSAIFHVTYLQDLATGSNVNVPIGKFGCIAANYHCVAGIPAALTTIYLSAKGTSGVFPGDPAPNDAISIDVGAFAPSGAPEILAIAGFRTKLIVFFRGQSLIVVLGEYDNAATPNHKPRFEDDMPQFGIFNHRVIETVENDLRFAGYDGMASASRNLFSGNILSKFLTAFIEPLWRSTLAGAAALGPFMVHNPIQHATYVFIGDNSGTVLVYENNSQLHYESCTMYTGLFFACGCRSFLGRVFMANRNILGQDALVIYQMGNELFAGENYSADTLGFNLGTWTNSQAYTAGQFWYDAATKQSYTCQINHTSPAGGTFAADRVANPTRWVLWPGNPITFTFELPWTDGRNPMRTKQSRFVSIDARGSATFTLSAYVDFLTATPEATMDFVGNDATSGRKANTPELYEFLFNFKTLKTKISGSAYAPLTIAGIRYLFSKGRFRR